MPLCTEVRLFRYGPRALCLNATFLYSAREKSTGRRVAIKKIKVGQFKDGLDMSAIREVKYLRELSHPNVIEVWRYQASCVKCVGLIAILTLAPGCVLFKDEP